MRRTLVLILALIALVSGSSAQTPDFVTTAKINEASLKTDIYKQVRRFYVDVTVRNASGTPKTITVWTNPAWSWVSDSKDVMTSQKASKNYPSKITLQPGEIHKDSVEMFVARSTRPITFRLGFIPNAEKPVKDAGDAALVWSNFVALAE